MNNNIYNEGFSSLGAKVAKAAKAGAADLSRPRNTEDGGRAWHGADRFRL